MSVVFFNIIFSYYIYIAIIILIYMISNNIYEMGLCSPSVKSM